MNESRKNFTKLKNEFTKNNYEKLYIFVPKGRKADVEALAQQDGKSINGLINALLAERLGVSDDDWKYQKF